MTRLEPLRDRPRSDFDADPYLRDIVERNLEIAAQCCIDICHRIISLERAPKPADYRGSIICMGELGVLDAGFARRLAPLAGFRNILVHEYMSINWDEVYESLNRLDDLRHFADSVTRWMKSKHPSED